MSNPSTLQTISQFFVLIGIIITGIASFTSYHFGKKADELKENVSQQEITQSQIDRQDLKNMLEPFVDFAQLKFPHINQSDALKKLADEFRTLEKKTNIISEKTNILADKTTSLENRISYYSLKSDEIKEIANVLKSYKNIKVSLYRENNPDIVPFINNLVELFTESGWSIKTNSTSLTSSFDGINLYVYGKGAGSNVAEFAGVMYNKLKEHGISIKQILSDDSMAENEISLHIGKEKNKN